MIARAVIWSASALVVALVQRELPRQPTSCGTNVVSATVVATYCSHYAGNEDVLDLIVLWRGQPGWFQRRYAGPWGGGGSRRLGTGRAGLVSEHRVYDGVEIRLDADFDAGTVTIGNDRIPLQNVNAVLVDGVDRPEGRHLAGTVQVQPHVPLAVDANLAVIRRSQTLVGFLQCEIAMPAPSRPSWDSQIVTVCDKLAMQKK